MRLDLFAFCPSHCLIIGFIRPCLILYESPCLERGSWLLFFSFFFFFFFFFFFILFLCYASYCAFDVLQKTVLLSALHRRSKFANFSHDSMQTICRNYLCTKRFPVSILRKSISGRHRPVRVADGPMTARCRFT